MATIMIPICLSKSVMTPNTMAEVEGSTDPPLTLRVGWLATPEMVKMTFAFCCGELVHCPL